MRQVALLVVVAGCGRLAFDELDGGVDARLPCPAVSLICEDFENTITGWSDEVSTGASVARTTVAPHAGAFALESRVPIDRDGSRAALSQQLPLQASGVFATRLWARAIQPLQFYDHLFTWHGTTTNRFVAVGADEAGNWVVSEFSPSTAIVDHRSTLAARVGVWTCVEAVLTFGTPGRIELFVDDIVVLDEVLVDPDPAYDQILVGVARADANGAHAVVDDVVVANQRIGCL